VYNYGRPPDNENGSRGCRKSFISNVLNRDGGI
jgi:hypothetical protein